MQNIQTHDNYNIHIKMPHVNLSPGMVQRIVQTINDLMYAPTSSLADAYRQAWQILGEGSPSQAATLMNVVSGRDIGSQMTGPYTASLVASGHLQKLGRGHYKWIGPMTPNTMGE